MSNNQDNDSKTQRTEPASNEKPNPNIKPPEYMVITEGFDPGKVDKLVKKVLDTDKGTD